jgi:twitching motility protein PilT
LTVPRHSKSDPRTAFRTLLGAFTAAHSAPGGGRSPHLVLIANPAIKNLIRESKTHQIDLVIETSAEEGMIS